MPRGPVGTLPLSPVFSPVPAGAWNVTIAEAQRRTELFLTGQMLEALRAVEYELPSFDTEPVDVELADVHARGSRSAMSAALPTPLIWSMRSATSC